MEDEPWVWEAEGLEASQTQLDLVYEDCDEENLLDDLDCAEWWTFPEDCEEDKYTCFTTMTETSCESDDLDCFIGFLRAMCSNEQFFEPMCSRTNFKSVLTKENGCLPGA